MTVLKNLLRGTIRTLVRPGLSPTVPVAVARPAATALTRSAPPVRGTEATKITIAGMPAERVVASDGVRSDVVMLYLHGGAFRIGSAFMYRPITATLAKGSKAEVVVPDYRLAPEHAFPAAHDDCHAAAKELLGSRPRAKLVLAGDSAGGGLALATAIRLRDEGETRVAGVVLISPWLDLSMSGDSAFTKDAIDPMLSREGLRFAGEDYLRGVAPTDPVASPLFAELRGLPPIHVEVGTDEVLLDDSTRLAARAREAGVDVRLEVAEGLWHDYPLHAGLLAEADEANVRMFAFVRGLLG